MASTLMLQPTLWRTCRLLANRTRLKLLGVLLRRPGLTVSAAAEHLKLPLPVASQYLRALEARGILTARRVGRQVEYRPSPATTAGPGPKLVAALRLVFQRETEPVETVFRLATAFTHPRRIEVYRALQGEPRLLGQLQTTTRISVRALLRHVRKLEARGFLESQQGRYKVANRRDALGRELALLAAG